MPGSSRQRVAVIITKTARDELDNLPKPRISRQVRATIERLETTLRAGQRPQDMRNIQGRTHTHRIDSGEYRILFTLEPGPIVLLEAEDIEEEVTLEQAAEERGESLRGVRQQIQQGALRVEQGRIVTIFRIRNRARAYRNL